VKAAATPLVAHVVHRFDTGGMENGVVNLINHSTTVPFQHAVIALSEAATSFASRVTRPGVSVHAVGKRPGKDPAAYFRLWRLLRRLRPAIVHTRNLGTIDCQIIAAAAGVPGRVHSEHGWDVSDIRGMSARASRLRRLCNPFIHEYITMSRDLEKWLRDTVGIHSKPISQIYNGVDARRFSPHGPVAAATPWRAGVPDLFVLGTVGRLEPTKNQMLLLRAFARVIENNPESRARLRLMLIGKGPMLDDVRATAATLGLADLVWIPGERADVPELMRSMSLFVLPSLNEGISNTLLEAMASGTPVVAARVGGNPELLIDGQTGTLFEPEDEVGLAEVIMRYVREPALIQRQGRAARERALRHFTLESMVAGYAEVYERLGKAPPARAGHSLNRT
jgi:sugar transferase (PEP-CTERM/EpsH1 system associated)